ncbi:hypothetical protein [Amycolatopsis sp. cmx-4-61]|uniref:hypothetical protein n=1 Tax=Amycolatopsis sp. cmx-4-61 TaxID=2790937 RepID=UPI00397B2060
MLNVNWNEYEIVLSSVQDNRDGWTEVLRENTYAKMSAFFAAAKCADQFEALIKELAELRDGTAVIPDNSPELKRLQWALSSKPGRFGGVECFVHRELDGSLYAANDRFPAEWQVLQPAPGAQNSAVGGGPPQRRFTWKKGGPVYLYADTAWRQVDGSVSEPRIGVDFRQLTEDQQELITPVTLASYRQELTNSQRGAADEGQPSDTEDIRRYYDYYMTKYRTPEFGSGTAKPRILKDVRLGADGAYELITQEMYDELHLRRFNATYTQLYKKFEWVDARDATPKIGELRSKDGNDTRNFVRITQSMIDARKSERKNALEKAKLHVAKNLMLDLVEVRGSWGRGQVPVRHIVVSDLEKADRAGNLGLSPLIEGIVAFCHGEPGTFMKTRDPAAGIRFKLELNVDLTARHTENFLRYQPTIDWTLDWRVSPETFTAGNVDAVAGLAAGNEIVFAAFGDLVLLGSAALNRRPLTAVRDFAQAVHGPAAGPTVHVGNVRKTTRLGRTILKTDGGKAVREALKKAGWKGTIVDL